MTPYGKLPFKRTTLDNELCVVCVQKRLLCVSVYTEQMKTTLSILLKPPAPDWLMVLVNKAMTKDVRMSWLYEGLVSINNFILLLISSVFLKFCISGLSVVQTINMLILKEMAYNKLLIQNNWKRIVLSWGRKHKLPRTSTNNCCTQTKLNTEGIEDYMMRL